VTSLFKQLPTYTWLSSAGINPSTSATHTYSALTAALKTQFGATPSLDCEDGAVYQVSYYYNLKGSAIDGQFMHVFVSCSCCTCR
jgi:ribonuclease T2